MTDRKGIFMEQLYSKGDLVIKPVFKRGAYWQDTFILDSIEPRGYQQIWISERQKNKVAPGIFTKWSN